LLMETSGKDPLRLLKLSSGKESGPIECKECASGFEKVHVGRELIGGKGALRERGLDRFPRIRGSLLTC